MGALCRRASAPTEGMTMKKAAEIIGVTVLSLALLGGALYLAREIAWRKHWLDGKTPEPEPLEVPDVT